MHSYCYLDNSVITKLRLSSSYTKEQLSHRVSLIKEIFQYFQISPENLLITDKLFLEIIGQGQVRSNFLKENKQIKKCTDHINSVIQDAKSPEKEIIKDLYNRLDILINRELYARLSQKKIFSISYKNLKKYPFHEEWTHLERKILRQAKNFTKNDSMYNHFIKELIVDSIIRLMSSSIQLDNISREFLSFAKEGLNNIRNFLIVKYQNYGILHHNLILMQSQIRDEVIKTQKFNRKKLLLRKADDFADSDMPYLAFHGTTNNKILSPVTIITAEPIFTVEEQLRYHIAGVGAIAHTKPKWLKIIKKDPRELMLGRTICVNFETQSYQAIYSSQFIDKNSLSHPNTSY